MIYYELLMLLTPEISQDIYDDLKSRLEKLILNDFGGKIETFDRWGKYLLSYPINKNEYGVYVLARFGVADDKKEVIEKIRVLFSLKFNTTVMRFMPVLVGNILPAEYHKPDSLEDAPRRERDEAGMWINDKNSRLGDDTNLGAKNETSTF